MSWLPPFPEHSSLNSVLCHSCPEAERTEQLKLT